ncbi:ACT domain-containing protein [Massilia litorea]|uniref:ACT domain-containing protein n=1 Tax=Massilia litorea TaxID=2769491 RepID=A0A7L9UBE7_9BURK|nr:ACT domain-containing protein [Massilia litorea]QOL51759.1 hypothetical protein LPB04_11200 [Massilia litorea]
MGAQELNHWVGVQRHKQQNNPFTCRIRLLIDRHKGILGRVAAEIDDSDSALTYAGMSEEDGRTMTEVRFTLRVKDRLHLAYLLRRLRRVVGVHRVEHERP